MPIQSLNPFTAEVVKGFQEESEEVIEKKLVAASGAFMLWKERPMADRALLVKKMAHVLQDGKEEYARLMTVEMGKPIVQGRAEVEKCAWACEYAAQMGPEWLQAEHVIGNPSPDLWSPSPARGEGEYGYVRFDPLGVVLAVMPWNFPFWQFFRFAAGALIVGNVTVLKHASNVPQCALAIEEIGKKAGIPDGVMQTLLVGSGAVEVLIADARIAAVTITGSTAAGIKVAEAAGRNLKKVVLELGGSDPFIVLADADLELACNAAVAARTINSGQSCIAAKRFIVLKEIAEEFTGKFTKKMQALVVGDPMDEKTQIGPLARKDLVDELDRQVQESVAKGATVLCGGKRGVGKGYFYGPTVLGNVKPGMPAYHEEFFGPVASVIVAQDAEDAVRIANDSEYGLGAAIWTKDIEKAEQMAAALESGAVFINDFVKSDPRLPFGGVKKSGYGRELGSYGIKEFVNIKTVVVK